MNGRFSKIMKWISASFQIITLVLLAFALSLLLKQQNDISNLKQKIDSVKNDVQDLDNLNSKIEDVETRIEDAENTLSDDIEEVRKTIILWSN